MPFQHQSLTHCWHGCNDPLACFILRPQSDEVEAVVLDEILEEANGTQKIAKPVKIQLFRESRQDIYDLS